MEAQSLVSHQHSWWFSCFSLREKLARSHNKNLLRQGYVRGLFMDFSPAIWRNLVMSFKSS